MTLPREVSEALSRYEVASWQGGASETKRTRAALESAILAYGDAAREGALREAAEAMERALNAWCVSSTDGRSVDALVRDTLASLASRPDPERARCPCGHSEADHRSPVGCGCLELCAPEPAPESEPFKCNCDIYGLDGCDVCERPSPRSETTEDR